MAWHDTTWARETRLSTGTHGRHIRRRKHYKARREKAQRERELLLLLPTKRKTIRHGLTDGWINDTKRRRTYTDRMGMRMAGGTKAWTRRWDGRRFSTTCSEIPISLPTDFFFSNLPRHSSCLSHCSLPSQHNHSIGRHVVCQEVKRRTHTTPSTIQHLMSVLLGNCINLFNQQEGGLGG